MTKKTITLFAHCLGCGAYYQVTSTPEDAAKKIREWKKNHVCKLEKKEEKKVDR